METALGLICAGFFILGATGFAIFAIVGSKLNRQAKSDLAKLQASFVTQQQFQQIRTGMMFAEVVEIIGPPQKELTANSFAGEETVIFLWPAGVLANITLTFQAGKLVMKNQSGL